MMKKLLSIVLTFCWFNSSNAQNVGIGTISHDASALLDGYKGVDYARLVPLLIESIKAQQLQIAAQEKN